MTSYQHSTVSNEPAVSYPVVVVSTRDRKNNKNAWIGGLLLLAGMFFVFTGFQLSSYSDEPTDSVASSIWSSFSLLGHGYRENIHHHTKTTTSTKKKRIQKKKDFWPLQLTGYPDRATQKQFLQDLQKIDWHDVQKDIVDVMTNSQPWWPADYGSYGGLFIRLSWHACGSYRSSDGRGGCDGGGQRWVHSFCPAGIWSTLRIFLVLTLTTSFAVNRQKNQI
jgi:hypothetical protein